MIREVSNDMLQEVTQVRAPGAQAKHAHHAHHAQQAHKHTGTQVHMHTCTYAHTHQWQANAFAASHFTRVRISPRCEH